ncbi:hypothetical protein EG327_008609 [Venturia inaequalis]|uniref:Altered inheritance of mitochondria protein 32 n=1 Tax=Venturia inaequalis TaxID=5025 RepID=A0A8H3UQ20_VENIN|nr:hypothetical protein EG327_008609 [Venturia inaequalis]
MVLTEEEEEDALSAQAILSRSIRPHTRPWPRYTQQLQYAKRQTSTLPTVELCPEPSCECRPTPEGLDIDHVSPMTKPYYDEHVIISTGTSNWTSRLDEDTDTGAAYQAMRYFLNVTPRPDGSRRFGELHNPAQSVLISNSSFKPTHPHPSPFGLKNDQDSWERRSQRLGENLDITDGGEEVQMPKDKALSIPRLDTLASKVETRTFLPPAARAPKTPTSIYTFPSGKYVTIPATNDVQTYYSYIRRFIKNFVSSRKLHPELKEMTALSGDSELSDHLLRGQEFHLEQASVMDVVILICGHGNRDQRCGVLGPLLQAEFQEKLPKFGITLAESSAGKQSLSKGTPKLGSSRDDKMSARVGLISHIGGHKWAGNLIIYFPIYYKEHPQAKHPLKGKGIWYGRVEPWHVEGIIEQTIKEGKIIRELFRGGMPGVRLSKEGELEIAEEGQALTSISPQQWLPKGSR